MGKDHLVSIVVCSYNGADFIEETINSILRQTYQNTEIILVDDGSCDHTLEIMQGYAKRDARIGVIHQENSGPSAAREAGWRISKGDYIILSDDDDVWSPHLVEDCIGLADRYREADAVVAISKPVKSGGGIPAYPWEECIEEDRHGEPQLITGHDLALATADNQGYGMIWGVLFKREFMEKIAAGFDEDKKKLPLCYLDDAFCRCKVHGMAERVVVTNQVHILNRICAESISRKSTVSPYVKECMYASEESHLYYKSLGWLDIYEKETVSHYLAILRTWFMVYAHETEEKEREYWLSEARRLYDKHFDELKRVKKRTAKEWMVYLSVRLWDKCPGLWFLLVKKIRGW